MFARNETRGLLHFLVRSIVHKRKPDRAQNVIRKGNAGGSQRVLFLPEILVGLLAEGGGILFADNEYI